MNITFLIGNGFDIGLGMKSKFSDYFPQYIKGSENKDSTLKALADDIDLNRSEWSYFERKLGQYTEHFSPNAKNPEERPNAFKAQFRDFESSFIQYLENEESKISFNSTDMIKKTFLYALTEFYKGENLPILSSKRITAVINSHSSEDCVFNFVTFNYTNTLEKCLEAAFPSGVFLVKNNNSSYKLGKIVHVHGIKNAFPIMGVNDENQISNVTLAKDHRFARYLVKPLANKAQRMNYEEEAKAVILESNIICIYGMSLGETDKLWWSRIMYWLAQESSRQLIYFKYSPNYTSSTQFDRLMAEDELLDQLTEYCKGYNSINVENLSDRIHIIMNKNLFEMPLNNQIVPSALVPYSLAK